MQSWPRQTVQQGSGPQYGVVCSGAAVLLHSLLAVLTAMRILLSLGVQGAAAHWVVGGVLGGAPGRPQRAQRAHVHRQVHAGGCCVYGTWQGMCSKPTTKEEDRGPWPQWWWPTQDHGDHRTMPDAVPRAQTAMIRLYLFAGATHPEPGGGGAGGAAQAVPRPQPARLHRRHVWWVPQRWGSAAGEGTRTTAGASDTRMRA